MKYFARNFCVLAFVVSTLSVKAAQQVETTYIAESPQQFGLDLFYVPISYPKYTWVNNETTDRNGHAFHLAFEWMPIDPTYGKLGLGLGVGLHVIKNVDFRGTNATLTVIPMDAFLTYRFDYLYQQILVPYLKFGPNISMAKQRGIEKSGFQIYYGWEMGGGLELCLNPIDRSSGRYLDMKTGINTTYLMIEYVNSKQLGVKRTPDLSHDEIRFGLRFEI